MEFEKQDDALLSLTAEVVMAYVSNNPLPSAELTDLIASVHTSLVSLARNEATASNAEPQKPAVPIKKSVTPDFIISLEDGKKFKSLKRHLQTKYGLTPAEYREKWNLPSDYPMVAPNYSQERSQLAKNLGLGRKPQPKAKTTQPKAKSARKKAA
ncbi:MucR family transcriptional regulator [Mesorhizobium sp. 10J20-29]